MQREVLRSYRGLLKTIKSWPVIPGREKRSARAYFLVEARKWFRNGAYDPRLIQQQEQSMKEIINPDNFLGKLRNLKYQNNKRGTYEAEVFLDDDMQRRQNKRTGVIAEMKVSWAFIKGWWQGKR
eukprot:TRINITY_DN880_c0_g1_i1.p1 TRINITY_DN880_c0_g1~~TRINITY_DN880_c0_g1_i1.p1  ORF type:complete len:134 (+),score=38.53 TRINITY_DN880_c0_g1_i1:30-404(+)